MKTATQGDTVRVHYRGTLSDGSEFDSSDGRGPLEFTIGRQQVISGFEKAVIGMAEGDQKTVKFPAGEAYGDRRPDLIFEVPRETLPSDTEVHLDDLAEIMMESGETIAVRIVEVGDDSITLDANHPLAGEDLTFELRLVGVGT